jgi:hypothetical protein
MKLCVLFVVVLGLSALVSAQDAPKPAGSGLKISDVQEMVKGGLSEDLIIAAIRKDGHPFDLSATDMLQLKKEGVSDNIIKVMMNPNAATAPGFVPVTAGTGVVTVGGRPSGATPGAGVSDAAIAATENNPDAPHDSGIYLFTENENSHLKVMTALERASTEGTQSNNLGHILSHGIVKGKTRAVIPGPRASIRTYDAKPVFYFYFEDKSAALGKSHGFGAQTVSNPNQFSLVRFEQKKESREVVIGTIGFASSSTGGESKEMVPFKSERVRPGVYKVIPATDMSPGEYAFVSASTTGAAGAGDIFDFGIKQNE